MSRSPLRDRGIEGVFGSQKFADGSPQLSQFSAPRNAVTPASVRQRQQRRARRRARPRARTRSYLSGPQNPRHTVVIDAEALRLHRLRDGPQRRPLGPQAPHLGDGLLLVFVGDEIAVRAQLEAERARPSWLSPPAVATTASRGHSGWRREDRLYVTLTSNNCQCRGDFLPTLANRSSRPASPAAGVRALSSRASL